MTTGKLQIQKINRIDVQNKMDKFREWQLDKAKKDIEETKTKCYFCRDLRFAEGGLKFSSGEVFGLIVSVQRNTLTCPECNDVVAYFE